MPIATKKKSTQKYRSTPSLFPSVITLALWRLRQTWRLLLVIGSGIIAAILLVCMLPLYSDATMSEGLRAALASTPQGADIVVQSTSERPLMPAISQISQQLHQTFHNNLGPYLDQSQFAIATQEYPLLIQQAGKKGLQEGPNLIQFFGTSIEQAGRHMKLQSGRLPRLTNEDNGLEIALTAESANNLHIRVGSYLYISIVFFTPPDFVTQPSRRVERTLALHVVGLFDPASLNNPFWHGATFLSYPKSLSTLKRGTIYTGLISDQAFTALLTRAFASPQLHNMQLELSTTLYWYFPLNIARITIYDLDNLQAGINNVQASSVNAAGINQPPMLEQSRTYLPSDVLANYQARIPLAQIPTTGFLVLILGLVLFFISMMTDVLLERQANALALLHSRGATRAQIFGSFIAQSIGLGLIGLLVGPPLAVLAVAFITANVLPTPDRGALAALFNEPGQVIAHLSWFAVASALITILTMTIAVGRSSTLTILAMRREAARSTHRTLWQRLNVDVIAALVALVAYGISVYLLNSPALSTQVRLVLLSPLTLGGVVCLLLAGILPFLRLFPFLLRLGARLAARSRGATAMLALAQLARSPRQSLRMTLLLTLATVFTLFAIIYASSQAQRIQDVANYQAGADFSGKLTNSYFHANFNDLKAYYSGITGVTSVTLGDAQQITANNGAQDLSIELRAVDVGTFAQTAIWTREDSVQSLHQLMQQLIAQRSTASARRVIPADVDMAMWNALHLTPGAHFTLTIPDAGEVNFVAVAEVQHIPTVNDGSIPTDTNDYIPSGGLLVDYTSYTSVLLADFQNIGIDVPLNYVWLKTRADSLTLRAVRAEVGSPNACCFQVDTLQDRRAIVSNLQADPLYLGLIGILAIGATTVMLLTLIGNLIASWLNVRIRLSSFVVLRALGATPAQIIKILLWEQGITYVTGIGLGVIAGILLSVLVLPYMVYTNLAPGGAGSTASPGQFYVLQSVPPVQVIIPISASIILAILLAICIIALAMMVSVVSRPAMNQVLRINED